MLESKVEWIGLQLNMYLWQKALTFIVSEFQEALKF